MLSAAGNAKTGRQSIRKQQPVQVSGQRLFDAPRNCLFSVPFLLLLPWQCTVAALTNSLLRDEALG